MHPPPQAQRQAAQQQSVVPPLQRADRYGPHNTRELARLVGACIGDEVPIGVRREEVLSAIVACMQHYERCVGHRLKRMC